MDTTDPEITFDEAGVCNHCRKFDERQPKTWFTGEEGKVKLQHIVQTIKQAGKGKRYDCIIGLSGGVDSSYLAYQTQILGLRPLAVHVDAGWNSELAVKNIENIVKYLNIDLYTHVVDWEEVKDLQVAFLRASVANQDVPQDHAFFAALYRFAIQNGIRYVLSGGNYATESVLPESWGYNAMDLRHLKEIYRRFGQKRLKTFPTVGFFQYYIYYPYLKGMKVVRPLNYIPYNKQEAIRILEKEIGWRYYGGKHYESRFTKFFQCYYLPKKFGFDKRKAHLSSLIMSGQITRNEALKELNKDLYPQHELKDDKSFVIKKLGLTEEEFQELLNLPNKSFEDYPSNYGLLKIMRRIKSNLSRHS
jgi:N-acetyl sugar amidotransferase